VLDWDVANHNGYSEQYREVIREDKVCIEGGTKAPDYCFRIGGVRKFFVEAKKPSVGIRVSLFQPIDLALLLLRYPFKEGRSRNELPPLSGYEPRIARIAKKLVNVLVELRVQLTRTT
jgi:hypothetical protein